MAINPSDTQFGLIAETVAGTTPASPTIHNFPYMDGTDITLESDNVSSNVIRSNRAGNGQRKTNYRAGGTLKTQLKRSLGMDLLFESALSGKFATNVLKASNVDTSITIEKKFTNGGSTYYFRSTGNQMKDMSLSVSASSTADVTFTPIGLDRTSATTALATSTAGTVSTALDLTGLDLNNFSISGLTATPRSLDLKVEHEREAQDYMGAANALAIGTGGFRKVTLAVTMYRVDLSADTLLAKSDTPVAVSFSLGTGADGYKFDIPSANFDIPTDSVDGSKALITVNFVAKYDATALTDFMITKLP